MIVEIWAQTQIFTVVFSRLGNEWLLIMIIKKEESVVRNKRRRRKPIWFKFVHIALGSVNFCYMMKLRICLWSKWAVKAGFEINKSNTFDLFLLDQARFHCKGTHPFLQAAVVLTAKEVFKALRQQSGRGVHGVAAGCWFPSRERQNSHILPDFK